MTGFLTHRRAAARAARPFNTTHCGQAAVEA